jgi:hypothetical protein
MHALCPTCGLKYYREPGYFVGAMVFSYLLAVLACLPVSGFLLVSGQPSEVILGVGVLELVALGPLLFRYSRLLWLHIDFRADPVSQVDSITDRESNGEDSSKTGS